MNISFFYIFACFFLLIAFSISSIINIRKLKQKYLSLLNAAFEDHRNLNSILKELQESKTSLGRDNKSYVNLIYSLNKEILSLMTIEKFLSDKVFDLEQSLRFLRFFYDDKNKSIHYKPTTKIYEA